MEVHSPVLGGSAQPRSVHADHSAETNMLSNEYYRGMISNEYKLCMVDLELEWEILYYILINMQLCVACSNVKIWCNNFNSKLHP